MPTARRPKAPVRRVLLERLARPLLARFLSAHAADFCAAHAFPIADLGASEPRDRALIHRLLALFQSDAAPALPEATLRLLSTLEALATTRGGERLIALDVDRTLPRATLGDEDLALTAILEQPELAARASALMPSEAPEAVDGFTEYDPAERRPLRFGDAERAALEELFAAELEARDRTRYCAVHASRDGKRLLLDIEYGKRPKTRDKLDAAALAVAPSTDINTERACAEIDPENGRLALHAPHAAIKELLRKVLGKVLAGDEAHFTAARVYDLSPFADLATALVPHGERLVGVALHKLTLRTPADSEIDLSRARRDIRHDAHLEPLIDGATKIGTPVAVRLYLTILDRRAPLKVELSAKQGKNRLQFNRADPEIVAIVRGYLLARGVLTELAPQARTHDSLAATA